MNLALSRILERSSEVGVRRAFGATRWRLVLQFVTENGGKVLFMGDIKSMVIGQVDEMWDAVALVEYPSSEAFVKIAMSPHVAKIGVHREAGLAGQLLIQVAQRGMGPL